MKNIITYIKESFKITKDFKQRNVNKEDPENWEVGDIVCGTWGYNMNIPEWYKIIRRTSKMFILQSIPEKIVSGHYNGQWESLPDLSAKPEKEVKARINKNGNVKVDNKVYVHIWDGESTLHGDDMD